MGDDRGLEGLVQIGEVTTRLMREALVEEDYRNREIAAAVQAYETTMIWCKEQIRLAGPYDDMRTLDHLLLWLGDRIREVQAPAVNEET